MEITIPIIENVTCGYTDGFPQESEFRIKKKSEKKIVSLAQKPLLVKVVGESMMPTFQNGDILLFDSTLCNILEGAIIVAVLNGTVIVKSILNGFGNTVLYSYNVEYKPIVVTSYDNFTVLGKYICIFKKGKL